jgi:hypothetical protein
VIENLSLYTSKTHFWVEANGNRYGLGKKSRPYGHGGSITGYTGDYAWRIKWAVIQSQTGKIEAGPQANKLDCACAKCEDIFECMDDVAQKSPPYNPVTNHCLTFANKLLEDCCLVLGSVVDTNRNAPPIPGSKK